MKKRTTLRTISMLAAAFILQAGFATTVNAAYPRGGKLPSEGTSIFTTVGLAFSAAALVYYVAKSGGGNDDPAEANESTDATSEESASSKSLLSHPVASSSEEAKNNNGLGIIMGISTAAARSVQPRRGLQPSNIEVKLGVSLGF